MTSLRMTRWLAVSTMTLTTLAATLGACSGSSTNISDPTLEEASVTAPDGSATEGDSATPDAAVIVTPDGGGKDGAPVDAGVDASKPKPPPPPSPGDPCAKENEIFKKGCGQCGRRSAVCLGGKVSDYAACEQENPSCILANETPGQQASGTFTLAQTGYGRLEGTCPNATTTTALRDGAFIDVGNTSGKEITATVWATNNGGPARRLVMAWYASPTYAGSSKADREACTKGVAMTCPAGLACLDTEAGLTGGDAIVIPPYTGQVTVYVGGFQAGSSGTVRLVVRTDAAN